MAKILIVDDRRANRHFLLTLLGYMKHDLLEASDGAAALQLVRSERPDLVITDILMPVMDGYQFTLALREDPEIAATPVIFYTATYRKPEARALAASCGVATVLPKPSEPQAILDAVNQTINTRTPPPLVYADMQRTAEIAGLERVESRIASYAGELDSMRASFEGVLDRFPHLAAERDHLRQLSDRFSSRLAGIQYLSAQLATLIEIALDVRPEQSAVHVLEHFFAGACRMMGGQFAALGILSENGTELRHVLTKGFPASVYRDKVTADTGIPGCLLAQRGARCLTGSIPDFPEGHPGVSELVGSSISFRGQVHGWIYFANKPLGRSFSDDDEVIIDILCTKLALFYENATLYDLVQGHSAELQIEMAMRSKAEAEVRQRDQQLAQLQKMQAIGQLTGGVAHDFNNMLTVIVGMAGMLLDEFADQPRVVAPARMIDEAAEQGAELTRRLLAFARKQPLRPRPTDICELVENTRKLLANTLGEQIEIILQGKPDIWPVLIDPSQLSNALLNLAINARDAMPGGGKLVIETGNTELDRNYASAHDEVTPGDYVMIAVTDNGTGIPESIRNSVMDPFFTTKEAGKGTGLGLSMVYGFVKQSGGHIKLYSEEGFGTSIKMYLPRFVGDEVNETIVVEAPPLSGKEVILVVEDDPMVRNSIALQLGSLGYETVAAAGAADALDAVETRSDFALLLTDVVLSGGTNGRTLADQIVQRRPSMKVLFTSGYTQNSIVHHGRLDPGILLLEKPYRKAILAEMVRRALEGQNWAPPPIV